MNSWDLQSFAAMCNAIRGNTSDQNYQEMFITSLDNLYGTGAKVGLDCFGNIVLNDYRMVFPAAVNQNITTEKSINILNSWFMNSYISNYSAENIVDKLHQTTTDDSIMQTILGILKEGSSDLEYAGFPAFGSSSIEKAGFFYYDTDAAALLGETGTNGGKSFKSFKDYMYALFDADITSDSNELPLEYEVAGSTWLSFKFIWADKDKSTMLIGATSSVASILVNYVHQTENKKPEMLTELINTDGKKVNLIGDTSIVVPVQVAIPEKDKGDSYGKAVRNYYNWVYQVYSGNISDSTSGLIDRDSLDNILLDTKTVSDFNEASNSLWERFTSCNATFRNKDKPSTWTDVGKNESIANECSRLVKVYPASQTMQAVSSVLSIADGTEFSVYSTMIYMTYLDWYGVVNKESTSGGTEAESKFDPAIYDPTSDIMNVNPSDIVDMMSKDDLENEVLNLGYLMLSPEAGRDYRKQMVYNGVSDFLYEQYNRIVYGGSSSVYSGDRKSVV